MKLKIFLLFIIYNLSFYIVATATVRYVSKTGSSTPPYTTWATASDSIQKCINICQNGDTVYVANGEYFETLIVNKNVALIGSSMDSTILNGAGSTSNRLVDFASNGSIENFNLIGRGINSSQDGITTFSKSVIVKQCSIININYGIIFANATTSKILDCIIKNFKVSSIWDECPNNNCNNIYTSNVIISKFLGSDATVKFTFGGFPTFTNNIVINEAGESWIGIFSGHKPGAYIKNNLVSGYKSQGISIGNVSTDTTYIFHNVLTDIIGQGIQYAPIVTGTGNRTLVEANIIKDSYRAFYKFNDPLVNPEYNILWNLQEIIGGQASIGDSNLMVDPMFVVDSVPNPQLNFDYHLQMYSPAIDKGNPNILDVDGTRSDIGMYGGPFGEITYYKDYAPKPPRNLSAIVDTNKTTIKWKRNTEADTAYYKVYRDTVQNFTADSTKLIGSPTDTFYVHASLPSGRYFYKVTCVDNQGLESKPSEEIIVIITSINDYPLTINDYLLYQNYPNPFNPSTTIGYKLKESGYVKLMVYDIKGELVTVLVNQEQDAGYYEVEFDAQILSSEYRVGRQFASGIYLYRIEVIGERNIPVYTEMKKMLLIK